MHVRKREGLQTIFAAVIVPLVFLRGLRFEVAFLVLRFVGFGIFGVQGLQYPSDVIRPGESSRDPVAM
jgi:hypothetical protein